MKQYITNFMLNPPVLSVIIFIIFAFCAGLGLIAGIVSVIKKEKDDAKLFFGQCAVLAVMAIVLPIPPISYITVGLFGIGIAFLLLRILTQKEE